MDNSKIIANGIVRAFIILTLIALLLLFLYKISTIIIYLTVSILIAIIGSPIVTFLKEKMKFKNTLAVVTTLILFLAIISTFFLMFIPLFNNQAKHISLLDSQNLSIQINNLITQIDNYLIKNNIDFSIDKLIQTKKNISSINFSFITDFFNSLLNTISSIGMGIASSFFISFFLLKDKSIFIRLFQNIIPNNHEEKIMNSVSKIEKLLLRYFSGILLQLLIVFILYFIVLLIFNVQDSLIIAFICALLNIIPYIGPLIGSIFAVTLTLLGSFNGIVTTEILYHSLYVLIGFFIVQFIDNNFTQPLIFSKSTNSHPLEIFLIILIFGFLFGITGMIIAVPAYTIIKVISKEFLPENKFIKFITKGI